MILEIIDEAQIAARKLALSEVAGQIRAKMSELDGARDTGKASKLAWTLEVMAYQDGLRDALKLVEEAIPGRQ